MNRGLSLPTLFKIGGRYKVEIRARDHNPAHCHVTFKQDELIVDLVSLTVMHRNGFKRMKDIELVLKALADRQGELLEAWRAWHD